MFERQTQHVLILTALLTATAAAVIRNDTFVVGQLGGISTGTWLAIAIGVPVLHQVYVLLAWRSELHHSAISRRFGKERGFRLYTIGFFLLFGARPLSILLVAISNRGTLGMSPAVAFTIAGVLLVPWVYLGYSVHRYFGFKRAVGGDHFDVSYRELPLVTGGIFRYTGNAMYTFGFILLWILGLVFLSQAALLAALFNHLYIWVHYYSTELPDMRLIYGRDWGDTAKIS